MAKVKYIRGEVVGVARHGGRFLVRIRPDRRKPARFYTNRGDYARGQVIEVSYHHRQQKDGFLTGVRHVRFDSYRPDRGAFVGETPAAREAEYLGALRRHLDVFRRSLGDWTTGRAARSGFLFIEGCRVEVDQQKNGWFRVYPPGEDRGLYVVYPREAAALVARFAEEEKEEEEGGPEEVADPAAS